jgi:hypothetical protein
LLDHASRVHSLYFRDRGRFTLTASAPGTYEVEAVADGFVPRRVSVGVDVSGRAHADFRLEQA